jgi:hypothetical protein
MLVWVIAGVFSLACIIGGAIAWRRRRRILGAILIVIALLVFVAPLPGLKVTVEIPPAAAH